MMRYWLPEEHITGDSKEVIRLATALIGTMAAVVLALLFASTRNSFQDTNNNVARMTTSVIELDHVLQDYGPEGRPLREALRRDIVSIVASIWQDDATVQRLVPPGATGRASDRADHAAPDDAGQSVAGRPAGPRALGQR